MSSSDAVILDLPLNKNLRANKTAAKGI